MQLRSGRAAQTPSATSRSPYSSDIPWPKASSSAASAPPMATPPYLPPELHQEIITSLFRLCTLRRHIIDKLLQQTHTPSDGRHDQIVRQSAIALMDDAEKATYRNVRTNTVNLSLVSKDFQLHALAAERKWLERKPMDITAFRAFCSDPSSVQYADTTGIVVEVFPKQDFISPPSFIDCPFRNIDQNERTLLLNRMLHQITPRSTRRIVSFATTVANIGLVVADSKLIGSLSQLWTREMKRLPKQVLKVDVIAKVPDMGSGALFDDSRDALIDRKMILKNFEEAAVGAEKDSGQAASEEHDGGEETEKWEENGEKAEFEQTKGKGRDHVVWECVN